MKVACRTREDERYFRVIVGPGETVLTFERDIVWNSLRQRRETEPLLYDLGRRTPGPGQAADRWNHLSAACPVFRKLQP
jgi:hypothetical protein